jgi:hypothetical protein
VSVAILPCEFQLGWKDDDKLKIFFCGNFEVPSFLVGGTIYIIIYTIFVYKKMLI